MFPILNLLNFKELLEDELMKSISKKITNVPFSIHFIAAYCKNFNPLSVNPTKWSSTLKQSECLWPFCVVGV